MEDLVKAAVKNFLAKEIEQAKKQAIKDFMVLIDKSVDIHIDNFIKAILEAIKEGNKNG